MREILTINSTEGKTRYAFVHTRKLTFSILNIPTSGTKKKVYTKVSQQLEIDTYCEGNHEPAVCRVGTKIEKDLLDKCG